MPALDSDLTLKAKFFRGLADPSRLSILEVLRDGPRNVSEIIGATGLSQSNTSMHLDCLHCCGLVARDRQGRYVYYRIRSEKTLELLAATERALGEVAEHIALCDRYRE